MAENYARGRGLYGPPGAWLAGFIKRSTIYGYTQNMKALDLVVSEKKNVVFSIISLWELYVSMETRFLIQPASKPYAGNHVYFIATGLTC